ncbi:hypothetical protein J6590_017573 [Homalodisca vitripennis]|nr:hypothetical protein J6590_017573 [Homalodisca vitripennis]
MQTGLYWTGPTGRSRSQVFSRPRQSQFLVVGELDWRQIYSSSQCTGSAFSHWTGVSAGAGSVYTRPASSPADWLQGSELRYGLRVRHGCIDAHKLTEVTEGDRTYIDRCRQEDTGEDKIPLTGKD